MKIAKIVLQIDFESDVEPKVLKAILKDALSEFFDNYYSEKEEPQIPPWEAFDIISITEGK